MRKPFRSIGLALALVLVFGPPGLAITHATTPKTDQMQDTLIAAGTLVRIETLNSLSSASNKKGDRFNFQVVDNVKAGNRTAVPAGTTGTGKVIESRAARGGRQDGSLRVAFDPLVLADGTKIDVAITRESLIADQNEHNGMAGSLEQVASVVIPGFFLLDFLRRGGNVTLAANAPFHVAVLEDNFLAQ